MEIFGHCLCGEAEVQIRSEQPAQITGPVKEYTTKDCSLDDMKAESGNIIHYVFCTNCARLRIKTVPPSQFTPAFSMHLTKSLLLRSYGSSAMLKHCIRDSKGFLPSQSLANLKRILPFRDDPFRQASIRETEHRVCTPNGGSEVTEDGAAHGNVDIDAKKSGDTGHPRPVAAREILQQTVQIGHRSKNEPIFLRRRAPPMGVQYHGAWSILVRIGGHEVDCNDRN
ncbi:uncharacterized protein EI90DRAFT_3010887 [Cantharellus anzutake]|uniref:uncharacterized protein n=1 Tax=Cantharellus anzutake TaxID=1750568 RepID=UPI001906CE9E|nr:uncharacterized protein EI90DRAFT_3010887 [Cantharellus anzutake]KAF8344072.1 hypothetical protein EI90DRAFT_3010887 [Cantharellus anzutake]